MIIIMITLLFGITMSIIKSNRNKITRNLMLLYSVWTFIILIISTLNLYNLYNVSNFVYFLWLINAIIFIVTVIIFSYSKNKDKESANKNILISIENSKFIFYLGIITMLFLVYYQLKYKRIIANMPLEYIRMARYDRLFGNGIEYFFFTYILCTSLKIILMISAILCANKKLNNKIFIIGIINLILYTLIGYGRMSIFEFVIYVIVAILINNQSRKKTKISFEKILYLSIAAIILIFVGASIVVIRLKGIENLNLITIYKYGIIEQIKQIVVYFTGGFRALDNFIASDMLAINNLRLGRLTFAGLEDILSMFTSVLNINFTPINSIIGKYTQNNILIGDKIYFNAFYTCLMNYTGDFSYFGIIIGPIIQGLLVSFSINNYIKKKNIISIMILLNVMFNALCSIYRWNYQFGQNIILLIILIILSKVKLKKSVSDE